MSGWIDYWPDWSSADALRLCSLYDAMSALLAAIKERTDITRQYAPGFNHVGNAVFLNDPLSLCDQVHTRIRILMLSYYVNHTAGNNGDFSGIYPIPMWSEEAMENTLEEELLPSPSRLSEMRTWLYQQYKIINQLRYLIDKFAWTGLGTNLYSTAAPGPPILSWDTAVNNFFATEPVGSAAPDYIYQASNSSGAYTIQLYSRTWTLPSSDPEYTVACSVDYYIKSSNRPDQGYQPIKNFPEPGMFGLYKSLEETKKPEITILERDELLDVSLLEPAVGTANSFMMGNIEQGDGSGLRLPLMKADGENGFEFRGDDW